MDNKKLLVRWFYRGMPMFLPSNIGIINPFFFWVKKGKCSWNIILLVIVFYSKIGLAQQIKIISLRASDGSQDSTYYSFLNPLTIAPKQTHILLYFRDTSSYNPPKYSYRLIGFDARWQQGFNTTVEYANLLGGKYEFQVKNLLYPARIASLHFQIEQAFWQKPWFIPMILGYVLLLAGIILYFFRIYKLRSIIRLQHVRNEIASDLHDDIGSTLSNISFLGEMAKIKFQKNPSEALPIIEKIIEDSHEMIQTMRGMVWTISPNNDNAQDFIDKIRTFAQTMLSNKQITLKFSNELEAQELSIEQQRNLFLVFKEIVHNIAKHARAQNVNISIKKYENFFWAKITDDGVGFEMNEAQDGNGLRNMQNRIHQLGGRIEINSIEKKGTTIKMMIPL